LQQQLGRGGGSKGQGAKGKPTTRQIHLAYRALEAFMDADEDEQEKDVKELGAAAARLTAVRAVLQQVKDEGDADEDMEKLLRAGEAAARGRGVSGS
jgi:endonuclease III